MILKNRLSWFLTACAIEAVIGIAAIAIDLLVGGSLLAKLRWDGAAIAVGVASSAPLLVFFIWSLRSSPPFFTPIRQSLDTSIRPLFEGWSIVKLAAISTLAGISEELFFRGLIQGGISAVLDPQTAVVLASLIFGCFHLINMQYAVVTAVIGVYFGELWIFSGSLLAPMAAHGFYDFVALVYFMRVHPKASSA